MADSKETLGVDLGYLYDAGKYGLPAAANELSAGSKAVPIPETMAFYRSGSLGTGPYGPMSQIYNYASEIQSLLQTSANNIQATGDTLLYLANHYHGADADAKAKFLERKKQIDADARLQEGSKDYQG